MNSIILGGKSFFEGLTLFFSKNEIRNISLIPIFMSLVLMTLGLIIGVLYIDDALNLLLGSRALEMNSYLKGALYVLGVLFYFFILYFFVFIVVSILAIPICQKISEKVFLHKKETYKQNKDLSSSVKSFFKMLKASLMKILVLIALSIFIFISSFIPFLYPVALLFTFLIVTWDSMDYSFELHDLSFGERLSLFKNNLGAFISFSIFVGILLFIPFVQLVVLPVAVIGSTCLYINLKNNRALKHDTRNDS